VWKQGIDLDGRDALAGCTTLLDDSRCVYHRVGVEIHRDLANPFKISHIDFVVALDGRNKFSAE
jgi:hypothetical protein